MLVSKLNIKEFDSLVKTEKFFREQRIINIVYNPDTTSLCFQTNLLQTGSIPITDLKKKVKEVLDLEKIEITDFGRIVKFGTGQNITLVSVEDIIYNSSDLHD